GLGSGGSGILGDLGADHGRRGRTSRRSPRTSARSGSCSAARASSGRPARSGLSSAGSGGAARGLGCGVPRLRRVLPNATTAFTATPATGLAAAALTTVEDLLRLIAALGFGGC